MEIKPGPDLDQDVLRALRRIVEVRQKPSSPLALPDPHGPVPPYSTDRGAAWLAIDVLMSRAWHPHTYQERKTDEWVFEVTRGAWLCNAWSKSWAHAVCLTVLKVLESEEDLESRHRVGRTHPQ